MKKQEKTDRSRFGDILKWPSGSLDFSAGCIVMGILNVTPDSFSDGGEFNSLDAAVGHGKKMAFEGASIIDVGAESTRPGSKPVPAAEQIKRAIPVIRQLSSETDAVISIDTYDPAVARAALEAGAAMINDITALANEEMAELAADAKVPIVLMHMQGEPLTMQNKPEYDDVTGEVLEFLLTAAKRAQGFGIDERMIFIDPGIGFGKTTDHNLTILRNIDKFTASACRVLLGASRKRFIGEITGRENPKDRSFGTAATTALAVAAGVSIVRVHDAAETMDVIKITNAVCDKSKKF
jgi:dihydropteroate synthase